MKKILFFSLLSVLFLPLLYITQVNAIDIYQLDQSQLISDGFTPVYSDLSINQTFKPLKNVLTRIDISMVHRKGGGNIILTVKDENTGEIVITKNQRMDDGDGWEIFDLTGDTQGYIVDPIHRYSIWISTFKYPDPTPAWLFSIDSSSYLRGTMRSGPTVFEGDFVFKTYGYDMEFGRENPDPVIQPVEEEESNEPLETDKLVEEIEAKTVTPDTPVDTFELNDEDIDENVELPLLKLVIVDDVIVDSEKKEGVTVDQEKILKITGTAGEGDKVAVIVGSKIYTATADEKGNWYVIISTGDIVKGTYTVTAQSKNTEGKGTIQVELFKLNVTDGTEAVANTTEGSSEQTNSFSKILAYIIYSLTGLLVIVLVIFFLYLKKKKEPLDKKAFTQEKKPPVDSKVK